MLGMAGKLKSLWGILRDYSYDAYHRARYNGYSSFIDKNISLFYQILIVSHAIEKGLSLKQPRPLFGINRIDSVLNMLEVYDPNYSPKPVNMATGVLESYLKHHAELGIEDERLMRIEIRLRGILSNAAFKPTGGTALDGTRLPACNDYPEPLALLVARASCRSYANRLVPRETIVDILDIAQLAPSQCNRQSTKVHCYQDKEKIAELLQLQGGSKGFSDEVYNLFVVAGDASAWGGSNQRNQLYVDAALYAMALMLTCQGHGLRTCPLNLAIGAKKESTIKRAGNIPAQERLVMMIAFGYPADDAKNAVSMRLGSDVVMTMH